MRLGRNAILAFFLGPALLLIIVFYVAPLVFSLYVSFTNLRNWDLRGMKLLSEEGNPIYYNYYRLFHMFLKDPDFHKVVLTTIVFTGLTLIFNVFGGLLLALAAYLMEEKLSLVFRTLWLLPRMTPVAVYALLWYYFFSGAAYGTLNAILKALGVIEQPVGWGTDILPWGAWMIIVYINALVGVSFGMIVFYSALKNIPWEHVVAARVDGASTWQLVRYILIPSIRWHLVFVAVWQLLSLLTTYAHIFLLVEWGTVDRWWSSTWALYVFMKAFYTGPGEYTDQGLAAAAATVLVVVGAGLGLLALRILGFKKMMVAPRGEI